jgi:hypothetical protein
MKPHRAKPYHDQQQLILSWHPTSSVVEKRACVTPPPSASLAAITPGGCNALRNLPASAKQLPCGECARTQQRWVVAHWLLLLMCGPDTAWRAQVAVTAGSQFFCSRPEQLIACQSTCNMLLHRVTSIQRLRHFSYGKTALPTVSQAHHYSCSWVM